MRALPLAAVRAICRGEAGDEVFFAHARDRRTDGRAFCPEHNGVPVCLLLRIPSGALQLAAHGVGKVELLAALHDIPACLVHINELAAAPVHHMGERHTGIIIHDPADEIAVAHGRHLDGDL